MDTTRELQMPSGCEVESATLHPVETLPVLSGMRGKLDTLKSRGLSKVHDATGSLVRSRTTMRDGAKSQVSRMQDSMRTTPMLWAGVAAGAGFGLGLIGRIAQWRSRQKQIQPTLVIIETSC